MNTERAKGCWRGLHPDEQIAAALRKGLSKDKSDINSNPVYRKLDEKSSQLQYDAAWDFWEACVGNFTKSSPASLTRVRYEREFPGSDPRIMEDMKHIAEAIGLATPGKLDKENGMATVKTVRNKVRKFMSQWVRKTNLAIPPEVHDSMAPVSTPAGPTPKF